MVFVVLSLCSFPSRSSCQRRVYWVCKGNLDPEICFAEPYVCSASSNWLNNFAVANSTPDFVAAAPFGAYIFLGLICVLGALYVYFGVPETKTRTLEELDELFGDKSGRSRLEAQMLEQAQRDVGLLTVAGIGKQHDSGSDPKNSIRED